MNDVQKLMNLNSLLEKHKMAEDNLKRKQATFDQVHSQVVELVQSLDETDQALASEWSTTCQKILEVENG